ncbi:hypothetical protein HPP92_026321 [Vanilla planifolia]|uniref:Phytocyanin domain-containing protein n=1 Tax=Vanilla planifolia TaxID=51239 RepID=A0A835PGZ2_VANPL|nr:hypothetical protein HPP92_026548 [Vanilla planifolia]KAG0451296.1 hypothetical protein HPP92_026321 [Vanilla planifolia]
MAPPKSLLFFTAAASLLVLSAATEYTVGAPGGSWNQQTKLSSWASNNNFKPGDTLLFSYDPSSHNVLEVTKANYDSCSTTGPIKTYNSGKDNITLTEVGKRYFICGFPGHCQGGMKLEIDTTAAGSPGGSTPPPSGSASPPIGNTPSTPGTGSTPSGPSASTPPSAASRVGLKGKLVTSLGFGMLLALAI